VDVTNDQLIEVTEDEMLEIGEFTVHVEVANDPDATHPVSYVFEHDAGTFFHGGDTKPTDEFERVGDEYDIDLAALAFGSVGRFPTNRPASRSEPAGTTTRIRSSNAPPHSRPNGSCRVTGTCGRDSPPIRRRYTTTPRASTVPGDSRSSRSGTESSCSPHRESAPRLSARFIVMVW